MITVVIIAVLSFLLGLQNGFLMGRKLGSTQELARVEVLMPVERPRGKSGRKRRR